MCVPLWNYMCVKCTYIFNFEICLNRIVPTLWNCKIMLIMVLNYKNDTYKIYVYFHFITVISIQIYVIYLFNNDFVDMILYIYFIGKIYYNIVQLFTYEILNHKAVCIQLKLRKWIINNFLLLNRTKMLVFIIW